MYSYRLVHTTALPGSSPLCSFFFPDHTVYRSPGCSTKKRREEKRRGKEKRTFRVSTRVNQYAYLAPAHISLSSLSRSPSTLLVLSSFSPLSVPAGQASRGTCTSGCSTPSRAPRCPACTPRMTAPPPPYSSSHSSRLSNQASRSAVRRERGNEVSTV